MKGASGDIFQTTMVGLETGLQVLHITTFGPQSCASNENVTTVLSNPDLKEFDQIPVRRGSRIVGVIERASCPASGLAEKCMHTLDDSILVSAQTPLTQFIPLMVDTPYRLVLGGKEDHGINGIVTRSDLLKLPVRLFAFSLVTYLELLMSEIIHDQFANKKDWWWTILSPQRRTKIEEKMDYLKQRNVNPPLLELTEFSDKRTILKKHLGLGKGFANDLEEIEDLRNKVAHAGNYAGSEAEILQFMARLRSAQHWIEHLTALMNEEKQTWLFQANPKVWDDFHENFKQQTVGATGDWTVSRYRKGMQPGDRVLLWEAGSRGGLLAIGELTGEPFQQEPSTGRSDEQVKLVWKVRFQYTHFLEEPIQRSTFKKTKVLQDMLHIRVPQGSNFKVTEEEWKVLQKLIDQQS